MLSSIQTQRQRLVAGGNCEFLDPDEFLTRATSRQFLQRADESSAAVKGLLDPRTGVRFFVEDEKLEDWRSCPR